MTDSTNAAHDEADAAEAPPAGGGRNRARSARLFIRDVVIILLAAILISFLIKTFLIRSFYIPSESMQETLQVDDRIIVNELVPDLVGLHHGDVVVFRDPGGWLDEPAPDTRNVAQKVTDAVLGFVGLAAPDSDEHLIKRVIGLPGDTVSCCGNFGSVRVNGVPLDEPYIEKGGEKNAAPATFEVTVPEGMIWVMGDNRYNSSDSLFHNQRGDPGDGFVPIDDVVGRAFVISWPSDRWTWLDNYPTTFDGVDEAKEEGASQ